MGDRHGCAVVAGGTVRCWGANDLGQLGNGTTTSSLAPVVVSGLSGVSRVSAGLTHTCAVLAGGAVRCWGSNDSGQLGDGTTTNQTTPVTAVASGATSVSAGEFSTCAIVTGAALCWGGNGTGQLGLGDTVDHLVPTLVIRGHGTGGRRGGSTARMSPRARR